MIHRNNNEKYMLKPPLSSLKVFPASNFRLLILILRYSAMAVSNCLKDAMVIPVVNNGVILFMWTMLFLLISGFYGVESSREFLTWVLEGVRPLMKWHRPSSPGIDRARLNIFLFLKNYGVVTRALRRQT